MSLRYRCSTCNKLVSQNHNDEYPTHTVIEINHSATQRKNIPSSQTTANNGKTPVLGGVEYHTNNTLPSPEPIKPDATTLPTPDKSAQKPDKAPRPQPGMPSKNSQLVKDFEHIWYFNALVIGTAYPNDAASMRTHASRMAQSEAALAQRYLKKSQLDFIHKISAGSDITAFVEGHLDVYNEIAEHHEWRTDFIGNIIRTIFEGIGRMIRTIVASIRENTRKNTKVSDVSESFIANGQATVQPSQEELEQARAAIDAMATQEAFRNGMYKARVNNGNIAS